MKKILLLLLVLNTTLFYSCEKKLDQVPISSTTTLTFYTQPSDFIVASNAVYSSLRAYPDRQINLSETRSDNLYAVSDGGVRDWEPVNSFLTTLPGNVYIDEAWSGNFNGIYKANTLLEQLAKNGQVITDATLRNRLEAEGKFLRAFFYFDLIKWFGKVPIVDHTLTPSEATTIPRSSVSDVYDFIISDLQFAIANLPDSYSAADKGRATKYAAKAILALVYMTRSAPDYGIEGPGLGVNEWSLALAQLNDIIASGKYSFLPDYASIFSFTNEDNAEVVFDVQYTTGLNPVVGATFPWLTVPDSWFQSQGKPIQGGLTIRPVSVDLLNSFDSGDAREAFYINGPYTYNGVTQTESFMKKWIDLTQVPSNRIDWPINFIVSRYTDILMLKAECILHGAAGSQTDVDDIVNQVRARAGLAPISNVTLPQLFDERRKEFAGEGSRWHDLVRSGQVESIMQAWIATEDVKNQMKPFDKNYIIYPIPQSEIDAAPGLYDQNQGY